ncbi:glycosyltransferase, partial [Fulvivirga lutimaris]|uniref:glycosyltransferase n=1 Tax=Fulvivirga lutimaris TaxID=1819566 RepID=UPI0012BB5903
MKITHLLYGGLGGHSNVFLALVKEDKDSLYEFSAIFYGIENPSEGILNQLSEASIAHNYIKKRKGFDLRYWIQVFRVLKEENPDVIFLHSSYNIIPSILYRFFSKSVIIVRETQANHLKGLVERVMLGVALLFSSKVVFLSELYKSQIEDSYGFLFNHNRVAVIPNGLNLNFFKPHLKDKKRFSIGMLSRIVKIKDHKTL